MSLLRADCNPGNHLIKESVQQALHQQILRNCYAASCILLTSLEFAVQVRCDVAGKFDIWEKVST